MSDADRNLPAVACARLIRVGVAALIASVQNPGTEVTVHDVIVVAIGF